MTITHFDLNGPHHPIPCKAFLPQSAPSWVVLGVHGFAGDKDSSVLTALGEALTARGDALVCFDLPAHGTSTAPDHHLRPEVCKDDLCFLAEYVVKGWPEARRGLFATSFGALITLLCRDELGQFQPLLRAPAITMAQTFPEVILPCRVEEYERDGGAWCGFERQMFVPWAFYTDLLAAPIPAPDRDTLVIHGTADDLIPFEAVADWTAHNPHLKLHPIPGADHRFKGEGELEAILTLALGWFGGESR